MPIVIEDRDGRKIEGGKVPITEGSCIGCVVVIMLAIVGLGYLIGGLAGLMP